MAARSIHALEQWYNGKIDEVAIFNVALEEDDIQTIMEKGLNESLGRLIRILGVSCPAPRKNL